MVCRFVLQIYPDGTIRCADRNPCAGQYVLYVLFVAWPTVPSDQAVLEALYRSTASPVGSTATTSSVSTSPCTAGGVSPPMRKAA